MEIQNGRRITVEGTLDFLDNSAMEKAVCTFLSEIELPASLSIKQSGRLGTGRSGCRARVRSFSKPLRGEIQFSKRHFTEKTWGWDSFFSIYGSLYNEDMAQYFCHVIAHEIGHVAQCYKASQTVYPPDLIGRLLDYPNAKQNFLTGQQEQVSGNTPVEIDAEYFAVQNGPLLAIMYEDCLKSFSIPGMLI